jgi:Domain of unknown function (DUF4424)
MKQIISCATRLSSAALLACAAPAAANDSSAAIGLGGLQLTQNDAVRMDSEDLFLSRALVTVKYRFTNTSTKDVETLVSFPLPPMPSGVEGELGGQSFPDWRNDLQFTTLVDGKPVKLEIREVVSLIGKSEFRDASDRLKALGWPIKYWIDYKFEESLQELPDNQKAAYVREGLLQKDEDGGYVRPNWQVTTHVTRKQVFPAGKTITVEHSYKPVAGGSVGGALTPEYRKSGGDYFKEYSATYCMDKAFLSGFDKRYAAEKRKAAKRGDSYGVAYTEHWLDYVLSSGANWKGPIKDFRLVIDKGKPDNLLSFCMTGVKKISPTRFEVRKTNFEPKHDIKILIAEFYDPNAI